MAQGLGFNFIISADIYPGGVEGNLRAVLDLVEEDSLKTSQSSCFISMKSRCLHLVLANN